MNIKTINPVYNPLPLQAKLHQDLELKRFNVVVWHRAAGKTFAMVNYIIEKALTNKDTLAKYAYIAPFREQAKTVVWDLMKWQLSYLPNVVFNEAELKVTMPTGAVILVRGADNPNALRGNHLNGVVLDEVADMPESLWPKVISPSLERKNGWCVFIGTPAGKNLFFNYYMMAFDKNNTDWGSYMLKITESGLKTPEEMATIKRRIGKEAFEQEYMCSFTAAVKGTYYGEEINELADSGKIGDYPYDRRYPVITAWDLGSNDATSVWFVQKIDNQIRVIDFEQKTRSKIPVFIQILRDKKYKYEEHLFPHDAKQVRFETAKTAIEQFREAGIGRCKVVKKRDIMTGISAVRSFLQNCVFNEKTTSEGLNSLSLYRSEYNERLSVFQATPRHDEHSHAADAFRYLATGMTKTPDRRDLSDVDYSFNPLQTSKVERYYVYNPLDTGFNPWEG